MDLEKQLEIQRKETSSALRILLGYAEKLAAKNLGKNREGTKRVFQRSEINWLVSFGDRTSNEHESGSAGAAPENV